MKLKTVFVLGLLVFCFENSFSQTFSNDTLVLWRGFEHHWTYNHRVNRLGDYYALNEKGKAINIHTAATGTGPDIGTFTSFYTKIYTPNLWHHTDTLQIDIHGKEKNLLENIRWVTLTLPVHLEGKNAAVVLNGFDLMAQKTADKMQLFSVEIDSVQLDSKQTISFRVKSRLNFDCQTLECPASDQDVDYTLTLSYVALVADVINQQEVTAKASFSWKKKTPPQSIETVTSVVNYPSGFQAFKQFSFTINKPLHYVSMGMWFEQNSKAHFTYIQWVKNMMRGGAYPKYSLFSGKNSGSAAFYMKLTQINLVNQTNTHIEEKQLLGKTAPWKGLNRSATSDEAIVVTPAY